MYHELAGVLGASAERGSIKQIPTAQTNIEKAIANREEFYMVTGGRDVSAAKNNYIPHRV